MFHESKVVTHLKCNKLEGIRSELRLLPGLVGFTSVGPLGDSYLVDPASSHMLVSKIKPCMSKFKQ